MSSLIKAPLVYFFTFLLMQSTFAQSGQFTQTTLPLKFIVGDPPPFLEPTTAITIQGKSIPIILDTGFEKMGLVLSPEILKNFKVKFTGQNICFKMTQGQYCEKEFIIPELKLGSFILKEVHGVVMPNYWDSWGLDRTKATEALLNGAIGFPILSQFNILVDPHNSQLILIKANNKPSGYDIQNWPSISFDGHLSTKLKIDGHLTTIVWDTGAMPSIVSRSIAKHFTETPCPQNFPDAKDKNCSLIETKSLATLNNELLPNMWFKLSEIPSYAPFDGLIGSNFYAENLVYFNFDNHKIYVKYKN